MSKFWVLNFSSLILTKRKKLKRKNVFSLWSLIFSRLLWCFSMKQKKKLLIVSYYKGSEGGKHRTRNTNQSNKSPQNISKQTQKKNFRNRCCQGLSLSSPPPAVSSHKKKPSKLKSKSLSTPPSSLLPAFFSGQKKFDCFRKTVFSVVFVDFSFLFSLRAKIKKNVSWIFPVLAFFFCCRQKKYNKKKETPKAQQKQWTSFFSSKIGETKRGRGVEGPLFSFDSPKAKKQKTE